MAAMRWLARTRRRHSEETAFCSADRCEPPQRRTQPGSEDRDNPRALGQECRNPWPVPNALLAAGQDASGYRPTRRSSCNAVPAARITYPSSDSCLSLFAALALEMRCACASWAKRTSPRSSTNESASRKPTLGVSPMICAHVPARRPAWLDRRAGRQRRQCHAHLRLRRVRDPAGHERHARRGHRRKVPLYRTGLNPRSRALPLQSPHVLPGARTVPPDRPHRIR